MTVIDNSAAKPVPEPRRLGGPAPKLSTRVSQKFERTKEAASAGVEKTKVAANKVKKGASAGVNWLKLKCNKTKLFQKK
ncbi:hypothetical protein CDL12_06996 [Handroanthus impetiginosus]|uniref:Uncharacterized protein n=1 Tax=Handroanthus impetiginosus TaxID=429701 RepID=A0A2G9HS14_9LAMI|nr:hypothetical protein CDL12_06996 [Handroanthus impetiginosus]